MRWILSCVVALGCDAHFSDLSPDEAPELDAGAVPTSDAGVALDAAAVDAFVPEPPDAGTAPTPTAVASGNFEGRGGYDAAGSVTLEHLGGDRYVLVTSDDFASAAVPSPVLLVSDRDALGARLQPSDQRVATLNASQIRGAHRFELTLASIPAYAWVYCEPFGVETARARLEAR
jgi:hypothetical protein